ncbi:tyrosine-type recombinase/integrase [Nitratifractor sp.]
MKRESNHRTGAGKQSLGGGKVALTDTRVKALKPKEKGYFVTDGGQPNLTLHVLPSGRKSWRYRYTIPETGRSSSFTIGQYPAIGLARAREIARELAKKVASGVDPVIEKKRKREEVRAAKKREKARSKFTFRKATDRYLAGRERSISDSHYKRMRRAFDNDCAPLHDKPLAEITVGDIRGIINTIKGRGAVETAKKTLYALRDLFDTAIEDWGEEWATDNVAASIAPKKLFAGQIKTHYPAIKDPDELRPLLAAIEDWGKWSNERTISRSHRPTALALKLLILTATRPSVARLARWEWIDEEKAIMTVPASAKGVKKRVENHGTAEPYRTPLSKQALAVLEEAKQWARDNGREGCEYVFPSVRHGCRPLSDAALSNALRTMGFDVVAHGFRSTFSTIANEAGKDPIEVEYQLGHSFGSEAHRAYQRSDLLERRRELMQWWGDFIEGLSDGRS